MTESVDHSAAVGRESSEIPGQASHRRLAQALTTPLEIGGKPVANRLWLAPMAGLGHIAFREVLDSYGGCGLMFSEMCNARAVPTENPAKSSVFRWRKEELPRLVCQLLGCDPYWMAEAAKRIESEGFFGVDINMGCSVAGIVNRGFGAALLREPDQAGEIVAAVRNAVSIPVFVKFRTGWSPDPEPAVAMARRLEAAGADALVFHPRVAPDRRSKPPQIDHIRLVSEAVSIPVFGNGNVFTPDDCMKMLERTGCAGVSLGRIAVARPWIFRQWTSGDHSVPDFHEAAVRLVEAVRKHNPEHMHLKVFKKIAVYFMANFLYGHSLLPKFIKAQSLDGVLENIDAMLTDTPKLSARPNSFLFTS